jgi:sortase A
MQVVDSRRQPLQLSGDGLALVTCFPFDALTAGGPLRYVVIATPV